MKTQNTPGPWRWSTIRLHNPERLLLISGNVEVAIIEDRRFNEEESEANACLIAAAPDLLEACKALTERLAYYTREIETCDLPDGDHEAATKAEAAIAKATGGQV